MYAEDSADDREQQGKGIVLARIAVERAHDGIGEIRITEIAWGVGHAARRHQFVLTHGCEG